MDAPEFICLVACGVVGGPWLVSVGWRLANVDLLVCGNRPRAAYVATLAICWSVLFGTLNIFATDNVRQDAGVQLLFNAAWLAALAVATHGLALLGLDAMNDALGNAAVQIVAVAMWIAVTACAVGANLGEGEFVGTTLTPLALSVLLLLALCAIFGAKTGAISAIASDHERVPALRLAGLLMAWGALFTHAAKGDWVSLAATAKDFLFATAAGAALLVAAIVVERKLGAQTPARVAPHGVMPALIYLGCATVAVFLLP